AGVACANRDHYHAAASRRGHGNRPHVRHAGSFQGVPQSGVDDGSRYLVRGTRRTRGAVAQDDRIVPVVERFDLHEGLLTNGAGVVAGPFTERPFLHQPLGMDETFDNDLRVRRNWQTGHRPADHLERLALHRAGPFVLVSGGWESRAAGGKEQWVGAENRRDRDGLAAGEVLITMYPAVMAGRDVQTDLVATLDHHAVCADVDLACVR